MHAAAGVCLRILIWRRSLVCLDGERENCTINVLKGQCFSCANLRYLIYTLQSLHEIPAHRFLVGYSAISLESNTIGDSTDDHNSQRNTTEVVILDSNDSRWQTILGKLIVITSAIQGEVFRVFWEWLFPNNFRTSGEGSSQGDRNEIRFMSLLCFAIRFG